MVGALSGKLLKIVMFWVFQMTAHRPKCGRFKIKAYTWKKKLALAYPWRYLDWDWIWSGMGVISNEQINTLVFLVNRDKDDIGYEKIL
jgi:hypothetical protein